MTTSTSSKLEIEALTNERIGPFIDLNDKLRKLTVSEDDINPTTIIAVGDQSAGKSSVLEAISGIDLPRGEGIKTRVPLVLFLRPQDEEYAEISCEAKEVAPKRISLGDIAKEIENLTDQIAGTDKEVRNTEIELKIFRHGAPSLTLIDLPGLTRVAIQGQQQNIEEELTKMYKKYMKPVETVILNVVTAVVDVTTSASLNLSKQFDPERQRTLICFTKLDQVKDEGLRDKILAPVTGFNFPTKNIICVRNRSSRENKAKVSYEESRKTEKDFFKNHPELAKLPELQSMLGTSSLVRRLVEVQIARLRETLPTNQKKIEQRLKELQTEVDRYKDVPTTALACRSTAQSTISKVHQKLCDGRRGIQNNKQGFMLYFQVSVSSDGDGSSVTMGKPFTNKFGKWSLELSTINTHDEKRILCINLEPAPACAKQTFDLVGEVRGLQSGPSKIEFKIGADSKRWRTEVDEKFLGPAVVVQLCPRRSACENLLDGMLPCAILDSMKEDFADECGVVYRTSFFFSEHFVETTDDIFKCHRGIEGMPGSHSPTVPVSIIRDLQIPLFDKARTFAKQVREVTKKLVSSEINSQFGQYHEMNSILQKTFRGFEEKRWKDTEAHVENLIRFENVIDTRNHYFMHTVAEIRAELRAGKYRDDIDWSKLDNDEQEQYESLVKVCAYWKTMRKRFVDNVLLAVQCSLFHDGTEDEIRETLWNSISALDDSGIQKAMSLREGVKLKLESLKSRIEGLNEARYSLEELLDSNSNMNPYDAQEF